MASFPNPISLLQLQAISPQSRNASRGDFVNLMMLRSDSCRWRWTCPRLRWVFGARASLDSVDPGDSKNVGGGDGVAVEKTGVVLESVVFQFQGPISSLPPVVFAMKKNMGSNFAIGLYISVALLLIAARQILVRKPSHNQHGSVADLVKRGQLKCDRRGISRPLKYEDPFNNPLVKVSKSNLTIEMCGKIYRLAPVTLTEEQQSSHQKRRSRAYKWKRPTIFLKEGDALPPDVDPDTVRWIPANHPFATTVSEIDEGLAQNNVYQKHGVPFRIKAEHEALQRKLESLQTEQKLNKVVIDPNNIHDFERPFKSFAKPHGQLEPSPSADQQYGQINKLKADQGQDSSDDSVQSEDLKNP